MNPVISALWAAFNHLATVQSDFKGMNPVISALWGAFCAYWVLAASLSEQKPAARAEGPGSILTYACPWLLAFLLLTDHLRFWPLSMRFLPDRPGFVWVGIVILVAGLGLAVWGRRHLGAYWSGYLVIREGHALIRNGPYAIVRHPIYAGITLGVLGTAVAIGEWRALVAVALVLAAHVRKIMLEEDWLLQQFGEEYARYRREVRAIIPFVL